MRDNCTQQEGMTSYWHIKYWKKDWNKFLILSNVCTGLSPEAQTQKEICQATNWELVPAVIVGSKFRRITSSDGGEHWSAT